MSLADRMSLAGAAARPPTLEEVLELLGVLDATDDERDAAIAAAAAAGRLGPAALDELAAAGFVVDVPPFAEARR